MDSVTSEEPGREGQRGSAKLLDGLVPEIVRRMVYSGVGALLMTEEGIRNLVTDLRLPKEAVSHLREQAEATKQQLFDRVAAEVRSVLESMSFKHELQRILSSVVLEIRTEIRFVPSEDTLVHPKVSTTVRARRDTMKRATEDGSR